MGRCGWCWYGLRDGLDIAAMLLRIGLGVVTFGCDIAGGGAAWETGCGSQPYPCGTRTLVALFDQPAATDFLTALHLSTYDTARPNALRKPNGLVHCRVRWVLDFGWWTQSPGLKRGRFRF